MKRTLSNTSERNTLPDIRSSRTDRAEGQRNKSPGIDELANLPLPPFKSAYNFDANPLLHAFVRDGIDALALNDKNENRVRGNLSSVVAFCIKNNELQVLTWLMARTGGRGVKFTDLHLSDKEVERIFNWTRTLPFKVSLDFSYTRFDDQITVLCAGVENNNNIEGLNLSFSFRSEFDIPGDIRFSTKRQSNKSEIYTRLCAAVAACPSLYSFEVTADASNFHHFGKMLANNPCLKRLSISPPYDNQGIQEAIASIADGLASNTNLSELELCRCKITPLNIEKIAKSLGRHSGLRVLALNDCKVDDAGAISLAEAIKSGALEELALQFNEIDDAGGTALANALAGDPPLKKMEISGNLLGHRAGKAFADSLKTNTHLTSLELAGSITDEFLEQLANALPFNSSLESLNLGKAIIYRESTLMAFLDAVERHQAIKHIGLKEIPMSPPEMRRLLKLMENRRELVVELSVKDEDYPYLPPIDRLRAAIAELTPVKEESANAARIFPTHSHHVEHIDTTRARYVTQSNFVMFDLTNEDQVVECSAVLRDELLVTGAQIYDPELDKIFPVRDPGNPSHVHPNYRSDEDPRTCSPSVQIHDVSFFKKSKYDVNESTLWWLLTNFFPDHPFKTQNAFIAALKASIRREIGAMLRNEAPPSSQRVSVVKLNAEHCDDDEEAKFLVGQYGVVPADYRPTGQPSIGNGDIVCIFAAAKLTSDEDEKLYQSSFPASALPSYGANSSKFTGTSSTFWAPYGGGNVAQYLNSSFVTAADGSLKVAADKTNTLLFPVKMTFTDRQGKNRSESMLVLLQIKPVADGKQLKLDYGSDYVLTPKEKPAIPSPVKIKEEGSISHQ